MWVSYPPLRVSGVLGRREEACTRTQPGSAQHTDHCVAKDFGGPDSKASCRASRSRIDRKRYSPPENNRSQRFQRNLVAGISRSAQVARRPRGRQGIGQPSCLEKRFSFDEGPFSVVPVSEFSQDWEYRVRRIYGSYFGGAKRNSRAPETPDSQRHGRWNLACHHTPRTGGGKRCRLCRL